MLTLSAVASLWFLMTVGGPALTLRLTPGRRRDAGADEGLS